jgi:plastocyanin
MRFSVPAAVIGAVAICGVVLARGTGSSDDVREIRLVARDMTYFDAATREANPTLRLKRGERIRLVLTNDDRGYTHNLVSPALGVSLPLLEAGKTQAIEVTVPDVPGPSTYSCGPHGQMMRGNIAIE